MCGLLPGVWWSSSSRTGVCLQSSVCRPSAACRRSTTSTWLCKFSKAKESTWKMNTVIKFIYFILFFLEKMAKQGDGQPERTFVLHKQDSMFFKLLCDVSFYRSVTYSLCCHTGLHFPPLWHMRMNICHFTAHLLCLITNSCCCAAARRHNWIALLFVWRYDCWCTSAQVSMCQSD